MLRDDLQPNIFDGEVELVPTRNGYGEGLKEAGEANKAIVALCADLTESTRTHVFAEAFPERFIQVGIAEQNMASVASGMAAMGKIPFIASYAMFSPGRSWEQVRTTIAYNEANVKIIGAHAGISVGPDGATHQAIEDMALMRVLPNMVVLCPCDVHEAKKATLAMAEYSGPVYMRIGREKTPVVTTVGTSFEIGKAQVFFEKDAAHETSVGIVATGTLVCDALHAAKQLQEKGIGASVMNMATIKPLDTDALEAFAAEHDVLVTVEEHQVAGGLGSAVAEYLSGEAPIKIGRVGVQDQYGQSGTMDELMAHYGLDTEAIVKKAEEMLR
jgi:transketolase